MKDDAVVYSSSLMGIDFLVGAYEHLGMAYPKWYKMDSLAKLALIGAEYLLAGNRLTDVYSPYEIAVVLATATGCYDTDIKYLAAAASSPSPSQFIYTLPNVMIGELCIRHGLKGENMCQVSIEYNKEQQLKYTAQLLESKIAKAVIAGWVEYGNGELDLQLMLLVQSNMGNGIG